MGEGESIIIILIVAAVSVVGLYEFYQWYVTSGYNNPASGTTAAGVKNAAVTGNENKYDLSGQDSSSATQSSGNQSTSDSTGSYNELMIEVNAYDGDVASMLSSSDFYAMTGAGLTANQVNTRMNAMENFYHSNNRRPSGAGEVESYLAAIGDTSSNAYTFATNLTYGG